MGTCCYGCGVELVEGQNGFVNDLLAKKVFCSPECRDSIILGYNRRGKLGLNV